MKKKTKDFIAWVKKQPPQAKYDFVHAESCAVAKYLKSKGIKKYSLSSNEVFKIVPEKIILDEPFTYAGILERAEKHG